MEKRRLLLISRRFWPLVGGAERVMASLAHRFHSMGHEVKVLTACWEPKWPKELIHHEVPVVRLPNPKTRGWGTFRFMSHLKTWLLKNRDSFDAVLISMLKHSAFTAIRALGKSGIPVVLRAEGGGATGDCNWHATARFGKRIQKVCRRAESIIAPSENVRDELLDADFSTEQVNFIPNGVELGNDSMPSKEEARAALADAHPILKVESGAPLVVYTGRLDTEKGLLDLIDAWKLVAKHFPNGRLWLVGEGADSQLIWDRIRKHQLEYQVILPGSFDEVTDVLRAADAFVLPSYQEGMSLSLLEAMSMRLPVIASDIPANQELIREANGKTFPVRNAQALSEVLLQVLKDRTEANQFADNAFQFVSENYSVEKMAESHFDVIEKSIQLSVRS